MMEALKYIAIFTVLCDLIRSIREATVNDLTEFFCLVFSTAVRIAAMYFIYF